MSINNGKEFINYSVLENETITSDTILSYDSNLNKESVKTISTYPFKHISNNKNIKKMKKIFISYSRQDVDYKDELKKYLDFLKIFNICDAWSCDQIKIGNWNDQIQKELNDADLVIMMLSMNFFSSKYILNEEILKSIQSIESGNNKKIFPIIVSDIPDISKLVGKSTDPIAKAIEKITEFQYGIYDTVDGKQRIFTLQEFKNRDRLEWALSRLADKIAADINLTIS